MSVHFERGSAVLGLIDLAGAERVQQRAQDAPHMRIVVAHEKSQLVEIDAEHGAALSVCRTGPVYSALTISRAR